MLQFKNVLEEFDINKSLITIIPDPVYIMKKEEMCVKVTSSYISLFSPNGRMVMDGSQAIFYIFQLLVLDYDWSVDYCTNHSNCLVDLWEKVIAVMREFSALNLGIHHVLYVSREYVERSINILKQHCSFKFLQCSTIDDDLQKLDAHSTYPLASYHSRAKSRDLPIYPVPSWKETRNKYGEIEMPVWMVRVFYLIGQSENFFGKDDELHTMCASTAPCKIPIPILEKEIDAIQAILSIKILRKGVKYSIESKGDVGYLHEVEDEKIGKEKLEEKEKPRNIGSEEVKRYSEEKSCTDCQKHIERRDDDLKELMIIKAQLQASEQNVKICEAQIKELEKQIKKLNERGPSGESKQMQKKMANIVASEAKLKESNKKLTEKNRSLEKEIIGINEKIGSNQKNIKQNYEKKISEKNIVINEFTEKLQRIEEEVARLKEAAELVQIERVTEKISLQNEISEKEKVFDDIRRTNMCLSIENEQYEKTNQMLLERLSTAQLTSSNHLETKEEPLIHEGWRFQLVTLRNIKDTIRSGNTLKQAKDTVEKLISLTNRSEIHQMANYELSQYEGNLKNYLQKVEMNIQKLKETRNVTDLQPLPDHPSLSDRFMNEYWDTIKKHSELADSECLICLFNMESSHETIKCNHCRRRYHSECAIQWLKTKTECPTCRRGLLDPSE